ncbi:MAG: hypothetical protein ACXVRH_04475 [Thermoleophilaceae bacterium]
MPVASADDNQDGILGNLPRSRPGVRSDKRDRATTAAKKAPAKPRTATKPRPAAAARPKQPAAPKPAAPTRSSDPIEQAVHLVGEVAETGIRTVAKVAGGVLRRLPRP